MLSIEQFYPLFQKPFKAVITAHQKPDGDAMGSSLALYHFLIQLGHDVTVVSPTNWAPFLDWMPGIDTVIDFEKKKDAALTRISDADYLFCLDFNTLSRTKNMEQPVISSTKEEILLHQFSK